MDDDPILARARLLISIANGTSHENLPLSTTSATSVPSAPSISARRPHQAAAATAAFFELDSGQTRGPLPPGSFPVTAIKGSRLLSTLCDVRAHVKKGAAVTIDGVGYALSTLPNCEWSANRLELADDYHGDTRAGAILTIDKFVQRSPTKKKSNTMEPVPSGDIRAAMAALDTFDPGYSSSFSSKTPPTSLIKKVARKVTSDVPATGGAPPAHMYAPPSAPASGSYLHNLHQQTKVVEEAGNRAMRRVLKKQKEDAAEEAKRKKEEEERAEFLHLEMETKARLLQEKTAARVALFHSAKVFEDRQKKLDMEAQLQKKIHRESLMHSEDHKMRMLQMKKETKQRLEHRKRDVESRRHLESQQMAKKLSEISESRRRNDHGGLSLVKRRERATRLDDNRPKTDGGTLPSSYTDLGSLLDNHPDNGYSKEYEAYCKGERVSRSMQESRFSAASVGSPKAPTSQPIIYAEEAEKAEDEDDDDGYWSNDSLDDLGHLPVYEQPVDYFDDMTACSAVTLGSPRLPGQRRLPSPRPNRAASRLKLQPIAVRPYVPVPQRL